MLDINRRAFFSLLAGAAAGESLLAAMPTRGDENVAAKRGDIWRSRTIELRPDDRKDKPPVVSAVCVQPGGNQLATAGDNHLAWIWNFDSGEPLHRLDAHVDWVRTLDYSPDGAVLATAGNDRQIIFWDTTSGKKLQTFAAHKEAITRVVYSGDGANLATIGFDDKLRIYDVAAEKLARELTCSCPDMRALAYSPDDAKLAAGGRDGKIQIWNRAEGNLERELAVHRQRVRSVVFSPDGTRVASSGEDRFIRVWRLEGDDQGFVLPDRSAKVMALVFLSADVLATAGSDNLIRLWDLARRTEMAQLSGHIGSVAALAARNGILISGSFDTTVRIWTNERSVAKVGKLSSAELDLKSK